MTAIITISYYPNMYQVAPDLLGSAAISESELEDQMERCVYPNTDFHHADHLRLAWHYRRTLGGDAAGRMQQTIRRFAASLGHPEKYHATQTAAWMRLVAAAVACTPQHTEFTGFLAVHPWLLDRGALKAFYSRDRLWSEEARANWVEPDLHPLPLCA